MGDCIGSDVKKLRGENAIAPNPGIVNGIFMEPPNRTLQFVIQL